MKRFNSSDSMAALISMCPSKEVKENQGYSEEFQAMLERFEQEDSCEETSLILEKKRRLGFDQVKALERSFELDNKLDPERKVKLALELGLQPRQVAIWFQNRRARWKTKQLERDYSALKSNFDALKIDYSNLEQEHEALTKKLRELKGKFSGNGAERSESVKEESPISDVESQKFTEQNFTGSATSDSNSNGAVKDESNVDSPQCFNESFPNLRSVINGLQYSRGSPERAFQTQFMRMEEQSLFGVNNEFCNFFSVDQSPTL